MRATKIKIIDLQTQQQIGKDYDYCNRNRARNRAENLNLAYGAHRYIARVIYDEAVSTWL